MYTCTIIINSKTTISLQYNIYLPLPFQGSQYYSQRRSLIVEAQILVLSLVGDKARNPHLSIK